MRRIELLARAKVNLVLRVLYKREDGYHEIESVMHSIGLHDTVDIILKPSGISVTADDPHVPCGEGNLAYKVAAALLSECGGSLSSYGAEIRILKGIPVAAGLGGGSADAAATLVGLNILWGLGFSPKELGEIGARVGADVPFCIEGGAALTRGKGERIERLPPLCGVPLVLARPALSVETARIYSEWDRMKVSSAGKGALCRAVEALLKKDLGALALNLENDLERVTFKLFPEVGRLKAMVLDLGAMGAFMSGSGPTVVGISRDLEAAKRLYGELRGRVDWACLTETQGGGIEVIEETGVS